MSQTGYKLHVLRSAVRSTLQQRLYYQEHSGNALAARWTGAVRQAVSSLRGMPKRGAPHHSENSELTKLRRLPVSGFPMHSIFYNVDENQKIIEVVTVLHGAQNLDEKLILDIRR